MNDKDVKQEHPPKEKRTGLKYLFIIFILACLIVLVTMFMRMRTMQEDFGAERESYMSSCDEKEAEIREAASSEYAQCASELTQMERRANASELLILAQNAYYEGNTRKFQGCMATLEGYADALSEDALEIYEELVKALRG